MLISNFHSLSNYLVSHCWVLGWFTRHKEYKNRPQILLDSWTLWFLIPQATTWSGPAPLSHLSPYHPSPLPISYSHTCCSLKAPSDFDPSAFALVVSSSQSAFLFPKVSSSLDSGLGSNITSLKMILFKGKSLPPLLPPVTLLNFSPEHCSLPSNVISLLIFYFLSTLVELGQEVLFFFSAMYP